jgi:hypothetical protein
MRLRGKGYRPDPAQVRKRRAGFHLLKARRQLAAGALPVSVSLKSQVLAGPGILDQGQTGSCTGHAVAGAITTRFQIAASPIRLVSPVGCYTVGRLIDLVPNPDGSMPALTDDGAEPSQVVRGVSEWGVTSATTWGDYPADPATINNLPTFADLEATTEFELQGAYFLNSTGDAFVIDLMTAIAAGYPVTHALCASDPTFENYTGGVLGAMNGTLDHYNYVVGYAWDGSDPDSIVVEAVNSWGPSWGEQGFYRADRAFVDQMQDSAVFDVTPANPGEVEQ